MNFLKIIGFFVVIGALGAMAAARDLKTVSGEVFKSIVVVAKDATGLQITHRDGVAFIDFRTLSAAEQTEFGFDPAAYAAGLQQKLEAQKLRREQQALAAQHAAARARANPAAGDVAGAASAAPRNQTSIEFSIDAPGFRFGPYDYTGRGFSNIIPPRQGGTLAPYPYNGDNPYPYYDGSYWGPTIIRRR